MERLKDFVIIFLGTFLLALLVCFIIGVINGCNPDLPKKTEWIGNDACYMADKCLTLNAFKYGGKLDCTIPLQKCMRYTDYIKCKTEAKSEDDFDSCWSKLGVRI